ncbi:MAG: A/G-specific adenine glycosylase [Planctomycetaceae bacterium]|nr:A/G-specific adenine glycosylase [Planctomycetaceae bacterium]
MKSDSKRPGQVCDQKSEPRAKAASAAAPDAELNWPTAATCRQLRRQVLSWFAKHRRDLPWRRTQDPYGVWVSEVMLQQTQVPTVLDYWPRFMQRFPTVQDLAQAPIEDVLRIWEGLGYYRRARQLHAAATAIVERHAGKFPTDFADVLALPGVGRYTAGAVLSISQQQSWPILEGNTLRLYSRLLGLRTDPTTSANQKILWQYAEHLVPQCRAGEFNQGLMEIGGQVCKVKEPRCATCPLRTHCAAYQQGSQDQIPAEKTRKTKWETKTEVLVLLQHRSRWLGRTIPAGQRWAGLWDFLRFDVGWLEADKGSDPKWPQSDRILQWLQQEIEREFGLQCELAAGGEPIRHGVTRFRILLAWATGRVISGRLSPTATDQGWRWLSSTELQATALNVTARKIFNQDHRARTSR